MSKVENLFWDSCVIAALLAEEKDSDLASIEQFLHDAKAGKAKIYTSTIAAAEILPSKVTGKKYRSFEKFLKDLEGSVVLVAPDPNIMSLASRLRDVPYAKKVNDRETAKRGMDVPDAIMLATATVLGLGYKEKIDRFHTYDNGKKRSVNGGKCVPILSFPEWCQLLDTKHTGIVQHVIDLNRCKPIHLNPVLPGVS